MPEQFPSNDSLPESKNVERQPNHSQDPEVRESPFKPEEVAQQDAENLEKIRETLAESETSDRGDEKNDLPEVVHHTVQPPTSPQYTSSLSHFAHRLKPRFASPVERKLNEVFENRDGKMVCRQVELNSTKPVSLGFIGCVHGYHERFDEATTTLVDCDNPVDVLCLLGDFFKNKKAGSGEVDDCESIIARIAKVKADHPNLHIVAILGNNDVYYHHQSDTANGDGKSVSDWRNSQSIMEERLTAAGVEILKDRTITLEIEKHGEKIPYTIYGAPELELLPPYGDAQPWLDPVQEKSGATKLLNTVLRRANTGAGDTECGRNKPGKSWKDAISARQAGKLLQGPTEKPDIILAHNPDYAYTEMVEENEGVDVFSSHTHGFQNLAVVPVQALIRLGATRFGTNEWVGYGAGSYEERPDGKPCNVHITAGLVGRRIPFISQRPDFIRAEPKRN